MVMDVFDRLTSSENGCAVEAAAGFSQRVVKAFCPPPISLRRFTVTALRHRRNAADAVALGDRSDPGVAGCKSLERNKTWCAVEVLEAGTGIEPVYSDLQSGA